VFDNLRLGVRALVYLRSMAKSLSTLAAIAEREYPARRPPTRKGEVSTMDIAEVERRWTRKLEAAAAGMDEDDLPEDDKVPPS
jgi:hypothetical protein